MSTIHYILQTNGGSIYVKTTTTTFNNHSKHMIMIIINNDNTNHTTNTNTDADTYDMSKGHRAHDCVRGAGAQLDPEGSHIYIYICILCLRLLMTCQVLIRLCSFLCFSDVWKTSCCC